MTPIASSAKAHARSPAIARIVPFVLFIGVLALRSSFAQVEALAPLATPWLYAVQAMLAAAALVAFRHQYVELPQWHAPAAHWLLALLAGLGIFVLWIHATATWMHLGESAVPFAALRPDGSLDWALVGVRLFGAVLVVPVMEELFWRSFLMRWLDGAAFLQQDPGTTSPRAVIASAAAFALAHELWLAALIAGLVFALLYRATRSLWVPIAAHAIANLALGAWVVYHREWSFW